VVAEDSAFYGYLWRRALQGFVRAPEPPLVDFAKELVVFIGAGSQGAANVEIAVVKVTEQGSVIVRTASYWECGALSAYTEPLHVVAIPKAAYVREFVEQVEVAKDCRPPSTKGWRPGSFPVAIAEWPSR
jgi:hypothetical protein